MTQPAQPAIDSVSITVDLLNVTRHGITVRHRATGREHVLTFEGLAIGSNEDGDAYTLILPRDLAQMQGIGDAP